MSTREPRQIRISEDRWATMRHVVEAIAIVAAGIWAFYTFIYQEKIKPANEPAALSVGIVMRTLGSDRRRDIVEYSIIFHNTGKTEVDVAADAFDIWGERYGARPVVRERRAPNQREYEAGLPIVSRRVIAARAELRDAAIGGLKGRHIIMEAGASESVGGVFAVPRGAYDLIHASVVAVPIKTGYGEAVRVIIEEPSVGGYWLRPTGSSVEDDNSTDFVLPR